MYNFKSFNLFSPTFVISKFSSNSKTDWVQCWTLIYLLYCPAIVNGDAFMHIYCPSGNIPRILVLFIKELPSYIYLTLYSVWQLAAMWNYMDLNLKDEIWEIQAGILLFFKLLLGVNKKKTLGDFWVLEQLSWGNHKNFNPITLYYTEDEAKYCKWSFKKCYLAFLSPSLCQVNPLISQSRLWLLTLDLNICLVPQKNCFVEIVF